MAVNGVLQIIDMLEEYSSDIQEGITRSAEEVAKQGVAELRNNSPKRTGSYRKGWRKKVEKGFGFVEATVYNATDWQLTHLLEHPHVIRNGNGTYGTSTPKVHISPVNERCISEYEKDVEKVIKNGG